MAKYVEDQTFSLPVLKNGVTELGDLWDCHQNSAVGQTLFSKDINSEDIAAIATPFSDYTANHVQGTEDKAKRLYVMGEIKAGLLGGLLEIGVKILFDKNNSRNFDEQEFIVSYRQETFRLKLRPSARNKINQKVFDQLLSGKIKASHLVSEVILGGGATASVKVSDLHANHKLEVSGEIMGKISIVIMSITVTAGAGLDETEKIDEHQTRISLHSIPPVKSRPSSLSELVQVIDTLPGLISQEVHFRDLFPNLKITGVPIKFRLAPIKDFVDLEVSRLYKQMSEDILNNLISLLSTAKDIIDTEFIKAKVLSKDPQLVKILEDAQSPLSIEISTEESSLRKKCVLFQTRATGILKLYAMGEAKSTDILKATREFENDANLPGVVLKVQEYVLKGRSDYLGLRLKEHNESFIYVTNAKSLADWLTSGKGIKILLSTKKEDGQSGVFFILDRLSESLRKRGIQTALVAPSISEDFSLLLKINGKDVKYSGAKEIAFALQVISIALGSLDAPVSFRFYSILASSSGVHLPFSEDAQFRDLANLIHILQDTASITICETPLRLRECITENDDKWKFVLVVDAVNSLVDGFQCFNALKKLIGRDFPELDSSFIVGSLLQGQSSEAPAVIAFKNGKIEAICFDKLDVFILLEAIKSNSMDLLNLVSLGSLGGNLGFYPNRVRFSLVVAELLNEVIPTLVINNENVTENQDTDLHNLLKITSTIVRNNVVLTISALAEFCLQNYPAMLSIFKRYSWIESSKVFAIKKESEKWPELLLSVKNFLKEQDPILGRIDFALESLRPFLLNIEEILEKIIDHPECNEDLEDSLKNARKIPSNTDRHLKLEAILLEFEAQQRKSESNSLEMKTFLQIVQQAIDVLKSYRIRQQNEEKTKENVEKIIADVINDGNCPEDIRTKIQQLKTFSIDVRIANVIRIFEAHEETSVKNERYFYLISLQKLLEHICNSGQLAKKFISKFLLKFFQRIDPVAFPSSDIQANIERYINQGNFIQALHFISKSTYSKSDFKIIQEFQLLKGISGEDYLVNMIRKIGNSLFLPKLWKCSKFVFLFRRGLNNLKVMREFQSSCRNIKNFQFLPDDISKTLQMHNSFQESDQKLGSDTTRWKELDDFLQDLQRFAVKDLVPQDLLPVLRNSILQSEDFYESLRLADSLFYWDEAIGCFLEPWDSETILQAIENIMKWVETQQDKDQTTEANLTVTKNESLVENLTPQKYFSEQWSFMYNFQPNFSKFSLLPRNSDVEGIRKFPNNITHILQYIIDSFRIDSKSLIFSGISKRIENCLSGRPGMFNFPGEDQEEKERNYSCNFMEIMACLFNCDVSSIYLKEICHSLSAFNKPIPVVIPNFRHPLKAHIHTLQILHKIPMLNNGQREYLFESPFNCILCLNLGNTVNTSHIKLLNVLLKNSSELFLEEGKEMSGLTELVPLTVETCDSNIWDGISKSKNNRTSILVAIHGNCLESLEIVTLIKPLCSSTILFCPYEELSEMKQKYMKIYPLLKADSLISIYINHPNVDTSEVRSLSTSDCISTLQSKMSSIIQDINIGSTKKPKIFNPTDPNFFTKESISALSSFETTASVKLISLIQKISCKSTKQLLKKCEPKAKYFSEIISLFVSVLTSEGTVLGNAISHLEYEMNILVEKEARSIWRSIIQLKEKLKEMKDTENPLLQKEFAESLRNLQACRLTLNDFLTTLEKNVVLEDIKAKCFENISNYIFNSGSALTIELENMSILKMILPYFDKIHSSCRFQVVTILGNDNDSLANSIFNPTKISNQHYTIGTSKLDFRIAKFDDTITKSNYSADLLTDYLLIINFQLSNGHQAEIAMDETKLVALLLSVSNLILLNFKDPESLNRLEISFLESCRLNSSLSPDFILINEDISSEIKTKLWNTIKNVSEVAKSHKFNLGMFENPLDKFIHIQGCEVLTMKPELQYNEARILRKSIISRCVEFDLFDTSLSANSFSAWLDYFLDSWKQLRKFSDCSEFSSCQEISKVCNIQLTVDGFKDSVDSAFHTHRQNILQNIKMEMAENKDSITEKLLRPLIISYLHKTITECQLSSCSECKRVLFLEGQLSASKLLDNSILSKYIKAIQESSFQQLMQMLTVFIWKNNEDVQKAQQSAEKHEIYSRRLFVSPERRFLSEVKVEYAAVLNWITLELQDDDLPVLSKIDAYSKIISNTEQKRISWEQEDWIETEIEDAIKFLYIRPDEQIYQMGMVRQLKKKISQLLENFELVFGEPTQLFFQWMVHVFALKSLLQSITTKQRLWEVEYDPVSYLHGLDK